MTTRASRSIASGPTSISSREGRCRPAQHRPDAGNELVVDDRAVHVVVRAALEGPHPVDGIGLRGAEHDHRHVTVPRAARLALPQPGAEVELRAEDEVGLRALGERERLAAERRLEDVKTVALELPLEIAPDLWLRLCEENRGCHACEASSEIRAATDVLSNNSATNVPHPSGPSRAAPGRPRRGRRDLDSRRRRGRLATTLPAPGAAHGGRRGARGRRDRGRRGIRGRRRQHAPARTRIRSPTIAGDGYRISRSRSTMPPPRASTAASTCSAATAATGRRSVPPSSS